MDILNYLRQLFFGKTKTQPIATTTKVEIEELPSTEEQDIDCDFCTMFGDDECCLHRTTKVFGMAMLTKASIVNSDKKCKGDTINYDGYIFNAVFSSISNRWVLVYEDEDESGDDVEDELYDQRMYRMYLNMMKAVKGDRWTFAEYKAVIARDKTRLNKIINGH